MNASKSIFLSLCTILVVFTSCEDDFDLNADYKREPVVYGVLDRERDSQIFMINHTFLGGGSAFDYSLIEDSSLYDNVDARIFWNNGTSSVQLTPEVIDNKDLDGLFFAPNQTVYSAPTSSFDFAANANDTYRLGVMADGDTIYAEAVQIIINDIDFKFPSANAQLNLVSSISDPFTNPIYSQVNVKHKFVANALKHKVSVRLTFDEVKNDGTSTIKSVEFDAKQLLAPNDNGSGANDLTFDYLGETFFQSIGNSIEADGSVDYREFVSLEFLYSAFGSELSKYLDVINPTGGVGQETPSYSNINDGEGHGIYSSKATYTRLLTNVGSKTLQELVFGQYTNDLDFCATQEGFTCE